MGHLTTDDFERILARARGPRPRAYVETGCNAGDQLVVAAPLFPECIGIEIDEHYACIARRRLGSAPSHREQSDRDVFTGLTEVLLPRVLAFYTDEPIFVLLDAHYCVLDPPIARTPFPLWRELELLRARTQPDIIVVDDVHTFGRARDDLRFEPGAREWEDVTAESISAFLGAPGEEIGDGYVVWR